MTKKKKLSFVIPCVIYPFDVMVCFGHTQNEVSRRLKRYDIPFEERSLEGLSLGRAVMFSGGQSLLWMPKIPVTSSDYGTLQHEIFHIVTMIMNHVNIPFDLDKTDEAYAYLVGYLTTEIYKKL